jgi:hypothetical protein
VKHLERDLDVEDEATRTPHGPHPAFAQQAHDLVLARKDVARDMARI